MSSLASRARGWWRSLRLTHRRDLFPDIEPSTYWQRLRPEQKKQVMAVYAFGKGYGVTKPNASPSAEG